MESTFKQLRVPTLFYGCSRGVCSDPHVQHLDGNITSHSVKILKDQLSNDSDRCIDSHAYYEISTDKSFFQSWYRY